MLKKALIVFILVFAVIFSACSSADRTASYQLIGELVSVSGEGSDEYGYYYLSTAMEGEPEFMTEEDKERLFGVHSKMIFEKIEDYAVFFSVRVPSEICVFKCYSSSDTADVAKMCMERTDRIKIALRHTPYEEKSKTVRVCVSGKLVLLCLAENADRVEERFFELT